MVRDRGLAHSGRRGEIAGAHLGGPGQLPDDAESGRVRERLEEADIRIEGLGPGTTHAPIISVIIYIDKYQYQRYGQLRLIALALSSPSEEPR